MIEKNGYVIVERGDTLGAISSKVGMSTTELQQANPAIKDINKIYEKQKIKTKPKKKKIIEEEKKEVETEPKKVEEKAEEAVDETPSENVKNSEAGNCCCMVAPWTIQQDNRSYILDMTEVHVNPDGSKLAKELVSKDQDKKEHELYVIAPPKKDGVMQFKKINVTYEFMKKNQKCDLMMLAESEKYREDVEVETFFEINSLGRVKGAEHVKSNKVEEPNYPHKSIDGVGSKSYQYRIKKEELDRLYVDYEKATPIWKDYILGQIENKEIELEMFLGVDTENYVTEGSLQHLIYNILGLNGVANVIEVYPWGSPKCKSQPIAEIHVFQKTVYKGELVFQIGMSSTSEKHDDVKNKGRNDRVNVTKSGFRLSGKIEYEYGDTKYIFEASRARNIDEEGGRELSSVKKKHLQSRNAKNLFPFYKAPINKFYSVFDKMKEVTGGVVSANLGLTKFELKVEGSHDEDPNGYELLRKVDNFEIGVHLLDGSAFTIDILEFFIKIADKTIDKSIWGVFITWLTGTSISELLSDAKEYFNDQGRTLKLELSIGAGLGGSLVYKHPNPKKEWEVEGKLVGEINVELLAVIKGDGKIAGVAVSIGAEVKTASQDGDSNKTAISAELKASGKKSKDLSLKGSVDFNGMTIYSAFYAEIGGKAGTSDKQAKKAPKGEMVADEFAMKRRFEAKGVIPLFDKWPKPKEHDYGKISNFLL